MDDNRSTIGTWLRQTTATYTPSTEEAVLPVLAAQRPGNIARDHVEDFHRLFALQSP
ncbi:hypothetical protein TMatcc_010546 [Talaromyces marneffei ATCC 18224]